ncbi:MAG: PqqD family protein [Patescibacteria group bacterium]
MKRFKRASSVLSKKIQNGWVVLEKNANYYRELNDVASILWSVLQTPRSLQELTQTVVKTFDVDTAAAEKDISIFIKKYVCNGFLEEVS